jgi:hypothetical protein
MRKIILITALILIGFTSCKTREKCPAYGEAVKIPPAHAHMGFF